MSPEEAQEYGIVGKIIRSASESLSAHSSRDTTCIANPCSTCSRATAPRTPTRRSRADRIRALVETQRDCFERSCFPGHVTASAWLLSPDGKRFLLTHHCKLDRWLQLGGHADGDADVAAVALREAREESGLAELRFAWAAETPVPVDLDVHRIPAHGSEPAHDHHDVRFVLVAAPGQTIFESDESTALEWFDMDALEDVATTTVCCDSDARRGGCSQPRRSALHVTTSYPHEARARAAASRIRRESAAACTAAVRCRRNDRPRAARRRRPSRDRDRRHPGRRKRMTTSRPPSPRPQRAR